MKSKRVINLYKNMPTYTDMANSQINESTFIYITENIIGDKIDLLIDSENDYLGIRVNGKASGDMHKLWSKKLRTDLDFNQIKQFCPVNLGVIRMIGQKEQGWYRVLSIVSWNGGDESPKFVAWEWTAQACQLFGIERMPQLYEGSAKPEIMKKFSLVDYMGVPKNGLIIIKRDPVEYIFFDNKDNVSKDNPISPLKKNMNEATKLGREFASLAVDEVDIVKTEGRDSPEKLFAIFWSKANDSRSVDHYIQRCDQEAGVSSTDAASILEIQLRSRIMALLDKHSMSTSS